MKLINFVVREVMTAESLEGSLQALEITGVIDRWAFCFHDVVNGAVIPHYHVYVSQLKPDMVTKFRESIEGGQLIGTVHNERDVLLYMMRHGKCDTASIVSNFNVEKVINS